LTTRGKSSVWGHGGKNKNPCTEGGEGAAQGEKESSLGVFMLEMGEKKATERTKRSAFIFAGLR